MACAVNVKTLEWVRDVLDSAGEMVRAGVRDGGAGVTWSGAAIDSRADCSGRLFFALRGERTDGHRFASGAFEGGSVALVVSDATTAAELEARGAAVFVVRDTQRALQEIARGYRRHLDARVVAVTGSSGKTTTKEYIRAVLRTRYRTHASPGNFNSLVGVPLSVLDADEDCEYMVCEVGANHLGEIDFLAGLLRPDIAVITNIGDAHVGFFGSRDAIAREKGALLDRLGQGGHAVLPRDDEYFEKLSARVQGKVSSFGRSPAADFRLANVAFADGALSFTVNEEPLRVSAVGDYNALNACAAFAVGEICGVDARRLRKAFMSVRPMPGRGRVHAVAGVTLVDESYNASPSSMRSSLAMLRALPARRRIAVLGDMKELGDTTVEMDRAIGEEVAGPGVDALYWMGEQGGVVRDAALARRGDLPVFLFSEIEALAAALERELRAGDAVLVKASRACRLDECVARVVDALAKRD